MRSMRMGQRSNNKRATYDANEYGVKRSGTSFHHRLLICTWLVAGALFWHSFASESLVFAQDANTETDNAMTRGSTLYREGNFNEAVSAWETASARFRQAGKIQEALSTQILLAQAYQELGQYEKSKLTLESALEQSEQFNSPVLTAKIFEGLGNIYFGLGKQKEGIRYFKEGLALARQGNDTLVSAGLLNSLGNVLTSANRNTEAIGAYTEAAVLADAVSNPNLEMTALVNSVRAAMQQGLKVNAEERLDLASLKISTLEDSHRKVRSLLTIGVYYDELESQDVTKSVSSQPASTSPAGSRGGERGVRIEQGGGPSVLEEVIVIPEISNQPQREKFQAEIRDARPDPAISTEPKSLHVRALESFQAAATLARQLGDLRSESYAWGHMGALYEESQQYDEALRLTRNAVSLAQKAIAPESLYRWHWQTARIQRALGNYDESQGAYQRAIASLQPIRTEVSVAYQGRRQSFRDGIGTLFFELTDLLLERGKADLGENKGAEFLLEARNTMEAFKAAELQDYFQDECVQTAQTLSTTLKTDAPTSAILYPIILKDRMELLVNYPSNLKQYTVSISEQELTSKVRRLREGLQDSRNNDYLTSARQLYDWLIQPIEADLEQAEIDTLVVVPDGALRTIPMGALYDGNKHLIQKFALATTPGLTLTDPQPINRENIKMLALGLTEERQGFPPLPYVEQELNTIQELYGGTQLLNKNFQIDTMQNEMREEDFSIVHIASHGLVESNVEDSFVLTYDEKITMNRLADLVGLFKFRKSPLELLTLSACETAAGDDKAALGLAGVAVKAGARSALATLWFIDDQVASDLVGEFYRQLQDASLSKAQALQRAQVKVLEDPQYQHPNYWSPFLLINNWL